MKNNNNIALALIVIVISVILRLVDTHFHLFHFMPIIAISLFAGSVIKDKKIALLVPIIAMLITDIYFQVFTNTPGFYGISQVVNYAALVMVALLGANLNNIKPLNILGFTIVSSFLFFVLSNFGVWLGGYYGFTFAGLSNCFIAALPFYKSSIATTFFINSFAGDIIFSTILFASYYFANSNAILMEKLAIK